MVTTLPKPEREYTEQEYMVQKSITIHLPQLKKIDRYAHANGMKRSEAIRGLVELGFMKLTDITDNE